MIDSATETRSSPVGVVSNEPISVLESPPAAIHPDMKDRATPLKDNPITEQEKAELRKAFGEIGNQKLAENLFQKAGVDAKLAPEIKNEIKKKPGLIAQIIQWLFNLLTLGIFKKKAST